MVKNENYYTIFGWMLNDLRLSGTDLIVYAVIYSFSQDGESEFKGSLAYLSGCTGASQSTIRRSLSHLEDLGYIEKTQRNSSTGLSNSFRSVVDLDRLSAGGAQFEHPIPLCEERSDVLEDENNTTLYKDDANKLYFPDEQTTSASVVRTNCTDKEHGQSRGKKMVKNENFYTVFGWMINELKLRGSDLIVFSIIYSFSQDGASEFKGSLAYMSEFTGTSLPTIRRSLLRLEELGYIEKTQRNKRAGLSNSFRSIVDLDSAISGGVQNEHPIPPREERVVKLDTRGVQFEQRYVQNEHPIYIDTDISTDYTKERKKEKEIYKEKEMARQAFEKMSDEELLRWGERGCDLNNPVQEAIFYIWCYECRIRKDTAKKWKGKVIKNDRVFEILKSHDEIMTEMGVTGELRDVLKQFLRNAYLNKHLISNDKLIDIICRLNEFYEDDETGKIRSVNKAVAGGWYDIRELKR